MAKSPRVFIGSSSETAQFATALSERIGFHGKKEKIEIDVWHQNMFLPGKSFIDTLIETKCDFAILVFGRDDTLTYRGKRYFAPRDNILFECGLFFGKLGKERVFIVAPHDYQIKIPSDLAGLSMVNYNESSDKNPFQDADVPGLKIAGVINKRFPLLSSQSESTPIQQHNANTNDKLANAIAPTLPINNENTSTIDTISSNKNASMLALLIKRQKVNQSDLTEFLRKHYITDIDYAFLIELLMKSGEA